MLDTLLRHAGEVVTREQLRAELWPEGDSLSYDDAINKAISYLRDALRDSSRSPQFIETLPKRGYRFVAAVSMVEAADSARQLAVDPSPELTGAGPSELPDDEVSAATDAHASAVNGTHRAWKLRGRGLQIAICTLLLLLACGAAAWSYRRHLAAEHSQSASFLLVGIAPFESEGPDSAGLAESFRLDLTDVLAQAPHLRVSAAHVTPSGAAGRQAMLSLRAAVLVFGRLSVDDGRIRLQLELARGDDATHLATFKYDVDRKNIIELRQEARRDLLAALKASHSGAGPALGSTDNAQAYAIFLQARSHLQQWNPDSWTQAANEFRDAIAQDPEFARAYSGLATTLIAMSDHGAIPQSQGYEEARHTAQKALELDPQLAEGHAVLGNIAYHHDWNFTQAEREYRRAIELDPAQSHYRVWLSGLLCMMGRFPESIHEVNLAHGLDPSWKSPYLAATFVYYSAGQPERSLAVAQQLIAMEPDSAIAHHQLGWAYWYMGQYAQAVAEWQKMATLEKDADRLDLENKGMLVLQSGGPKAYAELRLKAIESGKKWNRASSDFVPSEWFVYAGQTDNAIAALSSQIDRHDPDALQIAVDPAYASLRSDPRYQMLVHRVGFALPPPLGRTAWRSIWE